MCFVTHNRLILIIATLSIVIGSLTAVSSAFLIHYSDELALVTIHIRFLIACTFCTIGAGIIQAVSSLLYICRKIVTRDWIGTNAIVFGIFLLGISIAMVRFESTLPEGFDHKVVVNRTGIPRLDILVTTEESIKLVNSTSEAESQEDEAQEATTGGGVSTEVDVPEKSDRPRLGALELEEIVTRKTWLLKSYFGIIIADFLALPIFLGLVSSKSSKFDLKGHSRIQPW